MRSAILSLTVTMATISLTGCGLIQAAQGLFGSSSSANSGTEVSGNKLHVGHETTEVGSSDYEDIGEVTHGTDYEDVGSVHHSYIKQNGEYAVDIIIVGGLLALMAFIVFGFFKFLRRIIEAHKKHH